jgi:hypothetical protein
VQITQWDLNNANKRQVLHIKIALAKSELKTFQFLVSETKQKITALEDEFASIPAKDSFTTVEI